MDESKSTNPTTRYKTSDENEQFALRKRICADPFLVLNDPQIVRSLVEAERTIGDRNIIDLRGVLLGRTEKRLSFSETTREMVEDIARSRLDLEARARKASLIAVEARSIDALATVINRIIPRIMNIDAATLCLEMGADAQAQNSWYSFPEGGVAEYLALSHAGDERSLIMRPIPADASSIYDADISGLRSEALVRIGERHKHGKWRGLLAFASTDMLAFTPEHEGEIPEFLGALTEKLVERLLES